MGLLAVRAVKPALQYSQGRSKPWAGSQLVNCFSEMADGDEATEFAVMAIPGLRVFATVGTGPLRGAHMMGGLVYIVSGGSLWSMTKAGLVSLIGPVPGSGPVRMADNGDELAICSSGTGYVLSGGSITTPVGMSVSDVAYIDSYIVWTIADSDQVIPSGINDALSYDILDVFTAEGSPDGLKGLISDHRELQLFGDSTIEIFYNAGGEDQIFERQGNAFIERGCFDRDSIVKIDNSVQFLGDDRIVYRLDGYSPMRISTHAIEYSVARCSYARGFTYTQEGHKFYCLNTDVGSFVYDLATGAWHERKSHDMACYRVGAAISAWGMTFLLDGFSSHIYVPDLDLFTENGEPISVEIELPTLEASRQLVAMYAFEVFCETGVGLNDGQGADPQIMLRYSDDGGRTWSNELWRSLGVIGAYRTRAIWRRLGRFRTRQIKLAITDPVRRFVMGYYLDVR